MRKARTVEQVSTYIETTMSRHMKVVEECEGYVRNLEVVDFFSKSMEIAKHSDSLIQCGM